MGDTNQFNKPNLVDYTLIQKLNQGYHHHGAIAGVPSLFQKAGSFSFNLIKENLFMSIILLLLVIFLGWCYVEKQRQDKILEKLYQKKMAKVMLEEELQLFTDIPVELNINDLFKDINNDLNETSELIIDDGHLQNVDINKKIKNIIKIIDELDNTDKCKIDISCNESSYDTVITVKNE